jgi:alpha-L-rhamnosidase
MPTPHRPTPHRTQARRWLTAAALAVSLSTAGLASLPTVAAATATPARIAVEALRVDGAADPLSVQNPRPTLGWRLASRVNGERQTAFRVLVASRPSRLRSGRADVWDSGRVASSASVAVPYGGPALRPAHRYYWSVQAWDAHGRASAWTAPAWWETGLATATDWGGAQPIAPDNADNRTWSNFTLDVDFTIRSAAAGVVFRANDSANYYLWQVNTVTTPGKVLLRPHVQVNGGFTLLGETDLSPVVTTTNATSQHHLRIRADGATITTWIDGTQVNTLTNTALTEGTVGFRTSVSNGVTEDARYDNLAVGGTDGATLLSDDFASSPDPLFPNQPVSDGQLEPAGDPVLLARTHAAPLLRKSFTLTKTVAQARVYVYGLGFYELHLNGAKVGDRVLTPASTPYDKRNLYDTYDVTSLLARGTNAVGIMLGNGYGSHFSPYGFRWLGGEQAILMLAVTYADGSQQAVTTDSTWQWSTGAITADDIYDGETYDARLAKPGWDTPGYNASGWRTVKTVAAPAGSLIADDLPPIRVTQTLRPVKLTQPAPGVYVYDLGQDIAGWARIRAQGPAGTTIRLRTAEELGADGRLDTSTNRNALATDTDTLAGTGAVETYEPRFDYHGFRYVEVTGYPGTPTVDSLDGRVVHADVASTGAFTSSDPLLNQIWQNNRWSVLNNSMSLPTDNPVRDERTPPAMDVQAYSDASTREFAMDSFYAGYLADLPPGTALPNDAGNAQQPDMAGGQVTLAWTLYTQYGDLATLTAHYPAMAAFVDRNATDVPGHIWPANRGFGDWCPPDRGTDANGGQGGPNAGGCTSEVSVVNTALSYLQARDVSLAAQALGRGADATRYAALADSIRQAFNTQFLNASGTGYGDGRQVTSVLPLAFGMVPDDRVPAVGAQLVDTILNHDGGHLDTGIFGTRYLVDALARINRLDVAMTLLDQRTYPGFGYEISRGATSSWEEWLYSSNMETHDHAMFAGVNASLYTRLGGIEPAGPGYASVTVAPQVPPDVNRVAASIDTVRGTVASRWSRTAGAFDLDVTVPVNVTATVSVPVFGAAGSSVCHQPGAIPLRTVAGRAVYAVGSGHWHFSVDLRPGRHPDCG